jgi:hypothetical protein
MLLILNRNRTKVLYNMIDIKYAEKNPSRRS